MRCQRSDHRCVPPQVQSKMKVCKKCGEAKPLDAFGKDASTRDRLTRWCRECRNQRERWEGKTTPEAQRRYALKHQYGITTEQFDEMLAAQFWECAACTTVYGEGEPFHVDHDHACCPGYRSCGKCIRGILCRSCNIILGHAKDDSLRLESLAVYLRKFGLK